MKGRESLAVPLSPGTPSIHRRVVGSSATTARENDMKHIKLRDLEVSRIGLGTMGMSAAYTGAGSDDAESIRTIHRALDLGVTFIDTAEIYGPHTKRSSSAERSRDAGTRPSSARSSGSCPTPAATGSTAAPRTSVSQ